MEAIQENVVRGMGRISHEGGAGAFRFLSCHNTLMKIIEQWLLFTYIDGQFTPLSKPFKTKAAAEKANVPFVRTSRTRVHKSRCVLSREFVGMAERHGGYESIALLFLRDRTPSQRLSFASACSFHRSTFTPIRRSHRHSATSAIAVAAK